MFDGIFGGIDLDGTLNDINSWWDDNVQGPWNDVVGGDDVTPPGDGGFNANPPDGGGSTSIQNPDGTTSPGEATGPADDNGGSMRIGDGTSSNNGNSGSGFASGLTKAAINSGLSALQKGTGAASNQAASRAAVDRAPTIQNLTGNTGRTRDGYMNITDPVHSKALESVNPTTYYRYFATFMRGFAASETPA